MANLKLSTQFTDKFISDSLINTQFSNASKAKDTLLSKTGKGNEYLGWVKLPSSISSSELTKIREAAEIIQSHSQFLVSTLL